MNKQNIDLLFRNYIDHFGYFQNPNQDGYESYKWEAVEQVQKEWDLAAPDLSGMIRRSFSKTFNLINNRIVSPGNGLALLAWCAIGNSEHEEIREATDQEDWQSLQFVKHWRVS